MDPKYTGPTLQSKAARPPYGGWKQVHPPTQPVIPIPAQSYTAIPFNKLDLAKFIEQDYKGKDSDYKLEAQVYLGEGFSLEGDEVHKTLCIVRRKRSKEQSYIINAVMYNDDNDGDIEYTYDLIEEFPLTEADLQMIKTINVDSVKILYGKATKNE